MVICWNILYIYIDIDYLPNLFCYNLKKTQLRSTFVWKTNQTYCVVWETVAFLRKVIQTNKFALWCQRFQKPLQKFSMPIDLSIEKRERPIVLVIWICHLLQNDTFCQKKKRISSIHLTRMNCIVRSINISELFIQLIIC